MTTAMGVRCHKKLDHCPKGHEMEVCDISDGEKGRYCKQCGETTFQPNENRFGDSCRLRRGCDKYKMEYKEYGDKTRNAECQCKLGYHFENEDQRACVPNKVCAKGFGQGIYGTCENCKEKKMFSNTADKIERCKPLTNCEKQSRCTLEKSNGTNDNRCGPVVDDVTKCGSMNFNPSPKGDNTPLPPGAIFGIIFASISILIFVLLVFYVCYRKKQKARRSVPTQDEMDRMLEDIIRRAETDEKYCSKVLTVAQKEVEDRINNQIWALPKELFRKHHIEGKAELVIEKCKGQQHKFAINSYMQDWRGWRGNTALAIEELMECLKNDKVKREDIVYEIVLSLKDDLPEVVESYIGVNKRSPKSGSSSSLCACLFPCAFNEDKYKETNETSSNLLQTQSSTEKPGNPMKVFISPPNNPPCDGGALTPTEAGNIYRGGPLPSAPVIDEEYENPNMEVKGTHFYDRSDSLPVQASS